MTTTTKARLDDVEIVLRAELTKLIAEREGIDPTNRLYSRCADEAIRLIEIYRRSPRPPETEIEKILARIVENDEARLAHRRELAAVRSGVVAQAQPPAPDPTIARIVLKDESTGRLLRLTVPIEWVEREWK